MIFRLPAAVLFAALLFAASVAHGEVRITDAWVRATVAQQKATAAFMKITSTVDARLVEVRSAVAGEAEIHETTMDGERMKMRAIPSLPLPAGATVELKPGGHHIMLLNLSAQIEESGATSLTLIIETASGERQTINIDAPARALRKHGR
ncbi:MAG: copper chaperone PCu(A)C [Azoarcus sp.]|jgi:copper(I)-binding protein|nr:copper chaperone PCu(A)C [Azoarcus sp.]